MADSDWLDRAAPVRRAAFRALRGMSFGCRAVSRAMDRLAAGLLSAADLRAAQREEWRDFNATLEQVRTGLLPWESSFYDACLTPGDRVLLVGCGAGRDLIALASRGLHVDGIEPVADLVEAARTIAGARGIATSIVAGAFGGDDTVGAYDAYVFSYFCYTYIRGKETRIGTLRSIRRASPAARVLISTPSGESVRPIGVGLLRLANVAGRTDWRAEPGDVFGLDDAGFLRYYHAFDWPALEQELGTGGFRVARRFPHRELLLVEAVPID
jgi:SAM-dependent methyltransferase